VTGVASGMSSTSSKTSDPRHRRTSAAAALPETVTVGRVLGPHGLRGEVVVEVLTDAPRRFDPGSSLVLVREGEPALALVVAARRAHGAAAGRQGGAGGARARRATALLRFAGVGDREGASALRGGWLEIERSLVPPAPAGTYYRFELLGCRCSDGGEDLGEVVEVVEDGGGLLLIVADGSREVPVPFVARFLRAVDVEHGRIELDLPPGLIEACASRS
jgi:16S rRNA processing protein RimM